jgi:hypothetical protein
VTHLRDHGAQRFEPLIELFNAVKYIFMAGVTSPFSLTIGFFISESSTAKTFAGLLQYRSSCSRVTQLSSACRTPMGEQLDRLIPATLGANAVELCAP